MMADARVVLFAFAFFASDLVPVTADDADESAMKNLYAALQGNKPTDAVEPAPKSVSEAAPEAPVTSVDSKPVESPVAAEKSAMETLLDRTWPVGQADTGAEPASLTELAPATIPTAAPVPAEQVSVAANKVEIPVDAEKSAMESLLDRTWPVGQADTGADPASLTKLAPATLPTAAPVSAEEVSVAAEKVQIPVDAGKSAMETLLDRTWPVGQADTGAHPASLTELAPGSLPTAAPVPAAGVNDVASPEIMVVADEVNVGMGEPRQSTLQRVYASLVGRKERMAKPEYGLNIQKRLPDPIQFGTADEELVDAMTRTPRASLLQKDRQSIATDQAAQDADANEDVLLMQVGALLSRGRPSKSGTTERHQEL